MIKVEHLTKKYGDFTAVDDLSFEIEEGHVYGFLGPNGAGKSTTMNIMTGCLSASEGNVWIDGHDIFEEPNEAKKCIGYLPEQPPLYLNETPVEYLNFVGEAKGLKGEELKKQVEYVINQTQIQNMRNKRISSLSKGYKQRVGIAQALLGNPKVIILDEPTVGLDPIQIIEIRDLIKKLGEEHTVIFSSHILSEVQAICDQIMIISHGKLVAFDEPENLEKSLIQSNEITIVTDAKKDEIEKILSGLDTVFDTKYFEIDGNYEKVSIRVDCKDIYDGSSMIFRAFANAGKTLLEMSLKKVNLEDVFLELMADTEEDKEIDEEINDDISDERQEEEEC